MADALKQAEVSRCKGMSVVAGCVLAVLAGCAVGPDFHQPAPPADDGYGAASSAPTSSAPVAAGGTERFVTGMKIPQQWWRVYHSDRLDRLVAEALQGNPDIDAAKAALRQAHELYLSQRASWFPTLTGGLDAQRAENASGTIAPPTVQTSPTYNLYTAQLAVSYVPDVFGGTRRAIEAARAGEDLGRYQLEAAYLTLSSNVVVTALQEASLRGQIEATQRLLTLQRQLTDMVTRQRAAGTAADLDVLNQQAAQAQTAALLPPLQKQLGQTRDQLTALLGRLPAGEPMETFNLADLTLPEELPLSLPSALVAQRPDVLAAEANLHAASAEVGVALADMLPQFSITGDLGSSALTAGSLFGPYTGFWSLGGSLTQTLLDGGALWHRKKAAEAALDQAAAQYRSTVIQACQNVADTLRALQADADALGTAATAAEATRRQLDVASRQRGIGAISTTAVIAAEQNYRQAQLALVQAQVNRYADTAALFQALGGGWWNRDAGAGQEGGE